MSVENQNLNQSDSKALTQEVNKEITEIKDVVSESQIKKWKQLHRDVYRIQIPTEEGSHAIGYVRKPDLDVLAAVDSLSEEPIKAVTVLFKNCWLGGDETITESDELKVSASGQIAKLFQVRQATVKKL